mmetsp:Transcript_23027/g.39025  ORF Transcript_23027/g.39025 Transcript_23027/m.39025 type:complete len:222 (+) Transcript_23027:387-1052(+)
MPSEDPRLCQRAVRGAAPSIILFDENPDAGIAVGSQTAARGDIGGEVNVQGHFGPRRTAHRHIRIDIVRDVFPSPDRGVAGVIGAHIQIIERKGATQPRHDPLAAAPGQLGHRIGQLQRLKGRQLCDVATKEDLRQHLILRGFGDGLKRDFGGVCWPVDDNARGANGGCRIRHKAQKWLEPTAQLHQPFVQIKAFGQHAHPPPDQVELAGGNGVTGGAGEA